MLLIFQQTVDSVRDHENFPAYLNQDFWLKSSNQYDNAYKNKNGSKKLWELTLMLGWVYEERVEKTVAK